VLVGEWSHVTVNRRLGAIVLLLFYIRPGLQTIKLVAGNCGASYTGEAKAVVYFRSAMELLKECLVDSPAFRKELANHEKELAAVEARLKSLFKATEKLNSRMIKVSASAGAFADEVLCDRRTTISILQMCLVVILMLHSP
jgi:hypothetical protein